jgi:hypothetical protein
MFHALPLIAAACLTAAAADTPTGEANIHLSNGATATATFLPAPDGRTWMIITSSAGRPTILQISAPSDSPAPPAPPAPPPAAASAVVTVANSAAEIPPAANAADVTAAAAAAGCTIRNYAIDQELARDTHDPIALRWIGKSATKPRPVTFFATADGTVLKSMPTPTTTRDWLQALGQAAAAAAACPTCQPQRQTIRRRP